MRILYISLFVCLMMLPISVNAQEEVAVNDAVATPAPVEAAPATEEIEEVTNSRPLFDSVQYESLVFTHWEHVAIQDARRSRGLVRPPTDAELTRDLKSREDEIERVKPPPEKREIRLSGIVYHGGADWTIWLNEQRVTPEAIPEEVMDLKVYKTYIEFKWFDEWSNQILPIRLRPHQRFNIDTRIFLPG